MTEQSTTPREIGPERFQRRAAQQEERSVGRALLAGLALLALLVGVPVGLWLAGDGPPPFPTSMPGREDLTGAIGAEQLVGVLLWVAWLAWLQFALCTLVELASAIRGIGLPRRVPLSGPSQRFARVLVGSVLLASTAVGQAAAAAPATDAAAAPSQGAVVQAVGHVQAVEQSVQIHSEQQQATQAQADAQTQASSDVRYMLGDMELSPEEGAALVGQKVYVVQPPDGRYHDNLWDISERTLGEGRRYQEIFDLNKGRDQPDGHELSLARLIYPNWLLVVPADAEGVDVVTAVPVDPPVEEAPAAPAPQEPAGESDGRTGADGGAAEEAGGGSGAQDSGREIGGIDRGDEATSHVDLVGAGLLAAGVLAAIEIVRRRRRTREPDETELDAEVALRIGADTDRARWLNHALRSLTAVCQEARRPLPPVFAAVVDDQTVELRIAPAQAEPPAPWTTEDGSTWVLYRQGVEAAAQTPSDVHAPYPGLVSIGRDARERDVLLDLEAAGGPISVVGDPSAAFEVVTAIAAELATNAWSDNLTITADGLPDELAVLQRDHFRVVDDLGPLLPELEARRSDRLGADVLTGRVRPTSAGAWQPEYVILGQVPDAEVAARLVTLTGAAGRSPLGVVCAGALPGARWQLTVDASGTLEIPILGLRVRANQLSWRSIEAIAGLIEPDGHGGTDPTGPAHGAAWLPETRPDIPPVSVAAEVAQLATAPVRVYVLGPVEVQVANPIEEERRALATEIVVYLALHPEGVHPTVLASAVWPYGVTTAVREATFERVRDWLGVDASRSPYLLSTSDGRLKLSDEVILDWDVVCALLTASRRARTREEETTLLRRALRVARGPVLVDRPQGRYSWIARARLERQATDVLVDAAHRLSALTLDGGDPATAAAAARAGLRVRPAEQVLWRDLLTAQHASDGPAGVTTVAEHLTKELGVLGITDLEPETMALLDELLPGSGDHRALA